MTSKATNLTDKQLIQAIFDALEGSNTKYGFFLGAGASVASGIPAAKELSEKWLKIIDESASVDTSKWEKDPAKAYSEVFSQRFIANPIDGEDELQKYIDNAKPSVGYLLLAQILIKTKNNFVLTTNFDTMTEDALFSLENAKPLIIGHESLANYLSVNNSVRPTIVKLHHDCLLNPKNTEEDTQKLPEDFKKNLDPILENTHLIVIGYGGNDTSIMDYLKDNTSRKPIYWCCRDKKTLSTEVKNMLTDKDFIVEIKDFDRFMLMLNDKLGFDPLIDREDIKKSLLVVNAIKAAEGYQKQFEEWAKAKLEDEEIEAIKRQLPTWWDCELKAKGEENIDKKDEIYKEGLRVHSKSPELHSNYANFLHTIRNDHNKAEIYYKRALEIDPNHVIINGNYALFLKDIRNNYNEAEIHYKRALELDPNHVIINGNYAVFLKDIRNNYNEAEIHYKRALELDPNNVDINEHYALFLKDIRNNYNEAEIHYKRALELDPNNVNANGNYALFLKDIRNNYNEAEIHYKRALELDPNHVIINGNYAVFLKDIRNNYNEAEIHYKRALELDPNNVDINEHYALFLKDIRNNYNEAEIHYKRALELDPNNVNANGNYALFLNDIRSDYNKAEIYYKRALELDPNHVIINGNYAVFLTYIRKDYNQAEKYYKKALKLDSNRLGTNRNYAQLLLIQGKNPQAEAYLNKAFEFADNHKDLLAELWFYRLAHYPAYRAEAIERLDDLLEDGAKSRGWDFSENIKQAEKQGFEPIELLQEYADKISKAEDV